MFGVWEGYWLFAFFLKRVLVHTKIFPETKTYKTFSKDADAPKIKFGIRQSLKAFRAVN